MEQAIIPTPPGGGLREGWSYDEIAREKQSGFFFAASACKALISRVSRSGIAIFCNFLQLSEVSKTGEMQLSASFCSKLQAVRPLASADGGG
jgi:hypothetical protein